MRSKDAEKAIEQITPLTITLSQSREHSSMYHALTLAIEALKRQIPEDVTMNGCCPNCGSKGLTETGDPYLDYPLIYCNNCGQKLYWGEL